MFLIQKKLSTNPPSSVIIDKNQVAAQTIEIRGFRLTPAFPLAYDGSRATGETSLLSGYAFFDLASRTVLDRGNVASRRGLGAAWSPEFACTPRKRAR
jgi:hypothetical protein